MLYGSHMGRPCEPHMDIEYLSGLWSADGLPTWAPYGLEMGPMPDHFDNKIIFSYLGIRYFTWVI